MREATLAGSRILVLEDEFVIAMDVEQPCRDLGTKDVFIERRLAEMMGEADRRTIEFAAFPDIPVPSKPYQFETFARAVQAMPGARNGDQAALEPSTCDATASGP